MEFLITYDLKAGNPSPYKAFLIAAEREGLLYVWRGASFVNRLPNTTIWGVFESKDSANEAFDRALATASATIGYKVQMTRRATTKFVDAYVNTDIRREPNPELEGASVFETSRLHQLKDPLFAVNG